MRLVSLLTSKPVKRIALAALFSVLAAAALIICTYPFVWIGSLVAPTQKASFDLPDYSYLNKVQTVRGEPINLVVVGYDLEAAGIFEQMGWREIRGVWQEGLTQTARNLRHKMTPVSTRYVFNRPQDFAYQGEDSTWWSRHHARVWRHDLPDGTPAWFITASFDRTIGASSDVLISLPTHIIAPNIDTERELLGRAMAAKLGANIHYVDGIMPVLYRSNGDNSWYYTDGEVMLISKDAPAGSESTGWQVVREKYYWAVTAFLSLFGVAESGR